jgi:uncharacterized integral membrane protein (TIGR00698 family)
MLCAIGLLTRWGSPEIALGLGMLLAIAGFAPKSLPLSKLARMCIQTGVVIMGLSMNLHDLAKAGVIGAAFAAGTIIVTFALGALLGTLLKCEAKLTNLVSAGTAICGGSAIAATGSAIGATQAQMSVAIGTVFLLNAIGLYIFPPLGHAMEMTQQQFGTWCAIAVHDVSSVVGAATSYDRYFGPTEHAALDVATAVKLSRTLWIAPVAFASAWWFRRHGGAGDKSVAKAVAWPWFILWFVLAAAIGTFIPAFEPVRGPALIVAKKLLLIALLLIGCGLSLKAIASVGWRAIVLGVVLWVAISVMALFVVRWTVPGSPTNAPTPAAAQIESAKSPTFCDVARANAACFGPASS